jgi:hypothetical protein
MEPTMLKKVLVFAVTSGLAARAAQAWLARRDQRRLQHRSGERAADQARWADDGGRIVPPTQEG